MTYCAVGEGNIRILSGAPSLSMVSEPNSSFEQAQSWFAPRSFLMPGARYR